MDNDSEISPKKKLMINEKLIKKNTLESTSSSLHQKKLKFRNDFTSFKILENTNTKKVIDYPLCLSLFTNNKTLNNIKQKEKDNQKTKLNLNLKSLKPQNLKKLNFNNVIKENNNNKKIISRNRNFFNSLSPLNSKFNSNYYITMKKNASMRNNINYSISPPNIMAHKNPIIINQIGISNPIIKLNTKFNNISNNSTLEQDISLIKNLKGLSLNSINNNSSSIIKFNEQKIMPSLFSSPRKEENPQKQIIKNNKKKIINQIKKKVQNDIKNYEIKKSNLSPRKKIKDNKKVKFVDISNDKNDVEKKETEKIDNTNDISNNKKINEKNQLKLFDNKISHRNSTFYDLSKKNKTNLEEYFNINLIKRNSKKHLSDTKNDNVNDNDNQSEYKNEKKINNSIKDNKSKIERLTRLKYPVKPEIGAGTDKNLNDKVDINENKEENKEKNIDHNKSKNRNLVKRKETDYLLINTAKNKSILFSEEKKDTSRIRKAQSTKNLETKKIGLIKLKQNKFYLTICKKKENNLYKNNKFLRKWNEKLNIISSNNRTNRKIYIKKTTMLLDIQEKVNCFIYKEKKNLKMNKDTDEKNNKTKIYLDEILSDIKIKKENEYLMNKFILNYKFNCNTSTPMYYYIISSVEFGDITDILESIKMKKQALIKKRTRIRRQFQTMKLDKIPLLKLGNNEDKFLITKTKDSFRNDIDWMNSPINLLSIQEVIQRSIQYFCDRQKFVKRRRSTIRRLSDFFFNFDDTKIERQHSIGKKFSMGVSAFKKNMHKWTIFHDFSLLNQKKFFRRQRIKRKKLDLNNTKSKSKDKEGNKAVSDYSSDGILSSDMEDSDSNNIEDIYYNLLTCIIESKNKVFINLFEEKKKLLNINQQLIEGNTLLILSAREGNHAITKFLCEQGIDVNIQNNSGNTALHYAIGNQFYSIADILTRFGAREDIANSKGLLPWDCNENN